LEHATEFREVREALAAAATIRSQKALPLVLQRLADVRYRVLAAQALGQIGNRAAVKPLLETFSSERYLHARMPELHSLRMLGATDELYLPLRRFAGMPDPFEGLLLEAMFMPWFDARHGAFRAPANPSAEVDILLHAGPGEARLLVLGHVVSGRVAGIALPAATAPLDAPVFSVKAAANQPIRVQLTGAIRAVWWVPRAEEIPAPQPEPPPASAFP
jgi:hypothetical protein